MRHHEKRRIRVKTRRSVDKGDQIGPGARIIGATGQRASRPGPAHVYPQQAEAGCQRRFDQPQYMLRIHTPVQPVYRDDAPA